MALTPKTLRKQLNCPKCSTMMCGPIPTCINGHAICKRCKQSVVVCPECQAFFGTHSNDFFENLVEKLAIACVHNNKGCDFLGTLKAISTHEQLCPFRPTACAWSDCISYDFSPDEYVQHVEKEHSYIFKKVERLNIWAVWRIYKGFINPDPTKYAFLYITQGSGSLFSVNFKCDWIENNLYLMVQYLGKNDPSKPFLYTVLLNQGAGFQFRQTMYCLPFEPNREKLKTNPHAVTMKLDELFLAKEIPKHFDFKIKIDLAPPRI